jgi:glycosyltransferase involved in cell wall biosynthesis
MLPSVAVLMAVFNEATSIDASLASLAAQDYAGPWELLVADGGSTDGTIDLLGDWSEKLRLRIFDNPERLQSKGLNLLADVATSDILIRADAHSTYAPDYITQSVAALLDTQASAVGGPMRPEATTRFGRAVVQAYRSRLGIGPAPFHHSEKSVEADTVYLGAMSRQTYLAHGGLRTLPSGVAEDADFYYRLRKGGGRVVVVPAIRSSYRPRETVASLWRQFYRYGLGKADMLYINRALPSWRPLAPLVLVVGLVGLTAWGAIQGSWLPLLVLVAGWLAALLISARGNLLGVWATAIMHLAYGLGLIRGLIRSPAGVRAAVG